MEAVPVQQVERNPRETFRRDAEGGPDSSAGLLPRVVSIAAQESMEDDESPQGLRLRTGGEEPDDFMFPQSAEQRALAQMARGLREIVEAAREQSLALQSRVEQASALDEDIAAASRQLHERLSLSARMLKAFQSQIDRIDGLLEGARAGEERVAALNERMQQRIGEFETRLERYLERFDARLDEMVARSSKRFQAEIAVHEGAMKAAFEALPDLDGRLAALQQQVAETESRWSAADVSLRETIDNAAEAQCELKTDAERSMEVASHLEEQSLAAVKGLEGQLRSATEAARDLEARSARAHTLLPALSELEQTRQRLSSVLARLEPVLPIIQDEERYAAARVRHAAELVRSGLRRELTDIASAFQGLAEEGVPAHAVASVPAPFAGGPARPHRVHAGGGVLRAACVEVKDAHSAPVHGTPNLSVASGAD